MVERTLLPNAVSELRIMYWSKQEKLYSTPHSTVDLMTAIQTPNSRLVSCTYDPISGDNFISFYSNYVSDSHVGNDTYLAFRTFGTMWNYPMRLSWECMDRAELYQVVVNLLKLSGGYLYIKNENDKTPRLHPKGTNTNENWHFCPRVFYKVHFTTVGRLWRADLLENIHKSLRALNH